ncbi:MAG TPA: outer membrane beta-barrel protein [Bacteroidia bacterium]|nr:outer membrane beta-barrel protein [Bacteroidia bacterium]
MKKLLYTFIAISFTSSVLLAQDDSKSVRFGVFGRATPTWYSMPTNNNYAKGGAIFGAGFGLNMEFRITDVVSFQTGVGGDFDGGKVKYTVPSFLNFNPTNLYYTGYYLDKTPALVEIKGTSPSDSVYRNGQTTAHLLASRQIHTTYVTIPLILKMKTKEISGFKYFVDFGANVGVLVSAKANDITNDFSVASNGFPTITANTYKGLSIYKDCNPVRVGLNVGGGAEYRLSGSTSIFLSVNYVNSFISTVKTTSVYNTTGTTVNANNQSAFVYAAQNFKTNGIQVNVGILF